MWQIRLASMFPDLKADREAKRHLAELVPFVQRLEAANAEER